MSPRPGRISEVVEIALPRPRTLDMQFTQQFKSYSDRARAVIDQGKHGEWANRHFLRPTSFSTRSSTIANPGQGERGTAGEFRNSRSVWEIAADYLKIPTWLLPSPSTIGGAFVEWRGELWLHT